MKKLRAKLAFLYIFSFAVSVGPVAAVVIANAEEWFSTPSESFKIATGGIIAAAIALAKVMGKLKMPRRVVTFAIVFAMVYFLEPILDDILLLSGAALLGELADLLMLQGVIKKTKEKIAAEATADATSDRVEQIFEKYIGSGRT